MPTDINTEFKSQLAGIGTWCFTAGGKCESDYLALYASCMKKIAGTVATRPSRQVTTETKTPGTRGRPRKPTAALSAQNAAILKCVASGYSKQDQIIAQLKTQGFVVRPNHLGIALNRFRAKKVLTVDAGNWSITPSGQQLAMAA